MVSLKTAVLGAAIGDAFGVPYEFIRGPLNCHPTMCAGGCHHQKPGTFSDDTSMMLATCDSIRQNHGSINIEDIRAKFLDWMLNGTYTPDHFVFDIGNTVSQALRRGKGCSDEYSNGNGSLMRILPLAFTKATNEQIAAVSAISHAHEVSIQACIAYVNMARALNDGVALEAAIQRNLPSHPVYRRLGNIQNVPQEEINGAGYVVSTFEAALWALTHTHSFQDAIMTVVNFGSDTDTTACVTGGLAAIMYGEEGIPADWLETLRAKDLIERCLF